MNESNQQLRDKIREAVEKGGPSAAFDALSALGVAVEKDPEAGVGIRMRSGAGTPDGFTTTMYAAAPERPAGWPADIPFLPNVGGSMTLFDQPGRGFSVQWWKVPDPSAASQLILNECVAAGWRRNDAPVATSPVSLPGMQTIVLERGEVTRIVSSLPVTGIGLVQLLESRPGEGRSMAPAPPGP